MKIFSFLIIDVHIEVTSEGCQDGVVRQRTMQSTKSKDDVPTAINFEWGKTGMKSHTGRIRPRRDAKRGKGKSKSRDSRKGRKDIPE